MSTPKTILDRIGEHEAQEASCQIEINRIAGVIATFQAQLELECKKQDEWRNKLEELRFAVAEYQKIWGLTELRDFQTTQPDHETIDLSEPVEATPVEVPPPPAPANDISSHAPVASLEQLNDGSVMQRVYAAMAWMTQPVEAKAVADAIGCNWRQVAPTFGALARNGKIRPDPRGGWRRIDTLSAE